MNQYRSFFLIMIFFSLCLSPLVSYAGELENRLWKAAEAGNMQEVNSLLEKDVEINAKDNHGLTALMLASACGHMDVVKVLPSSQVRNFLSPLLIK